MKKLLVAIDFENGTDQIIRASNEIVNGRETEVLFLHVVDCVPIPLLSVDKIYRDPNSGNPISQHDLCQKYKDKLEERHDFSDFKNFDIKVVFGKPAKEIVACQNRFQPDLTVMAVKKNKTLMKTVMGSVVKKVVHNSSFDHLLINEFHDKRMKNALVTMPTFKEQGKYIEKLSLVSSLLDCEVSFYCAITTMHPEIRNRIEANQEFYFDREIDRQYKEELGYIEELKKISFSEASFKVNKARRSLVSDSILKEASEQNIDLVIVKPSERSTFNRFLSGSVSDELLEKTTISLYLMGDN